MLSHRYVAVAVTALAFAVSGCSSDEASRQNGAAQESDDQGDTFAEILEQKHGISVDSNTAADIANVACDSPTQGVGLYNAQQELGQRYPDINRSNPNAVGVAMSAAVLAYCPGRLP